VPPVLSYSPLMAALCVFTFGVLSHAAMVLRGRWPVVGVACSGGGNRRGLFGRLHACPLN
jgi:hypothetical protein